jgi:glutathione synthase/RimK-type ligase-like ATP-grasp enzyme
MTKNILILTEPADLHAHAVALSLRLRGVDALLWYTTDFPTRASESILFPARGQGRVRISAIGGREVATDEVSCVWRRRPGHVVDAAALHPADRQFAESECAIFRHSLFDVLSPSALWVNLPGAALRAGRKPVQYQAAMRAGLSTPDTLFSNDPYEIRNFIREHGGRVVYKTFRPYSWRNEETTWAPYTSLLTEELLVADELLRATPGIFQEYVPKAYELRVTFIGRRPFAAKILSQETTAGKLDWRKAYSELKMEPYDLPQLVTDACRGLMDSLGLVFGCFDFIVTVSQQYVFLEVNEMGQFLFVEEWADLPVLGAFTELLAQGRSDFDWDAKQPHVRWSALKAEALVLTRQAEAAHVQAPSSTVDEAATAAR